MAEVAVVEIVAFRDCRRDHDFVGGRWVLSWASLRPSRLALFVIAEAADGEATSTSAPVTCSALE